MTNIDFGSAFVEFFDLFWMFGEQKGGFGGEPGEENREGERERR